jgi:S1-C subfamily serine protease
MLNLRQFIGISAGRAIEMRRAGKAGSMSGHAVSLLFVGMLLLPRLCFSLEPEEIFKTAEPGIVVVLAADAKGEKNTLGSGVLISPLDVVTGCSVVEAAATIVVTQGSTLRKAALQYRDAERGLCQLHLADPLPAARPASPAASTGVATGQEIYIVGSPRGMERTIARTMISGVRATSGNAASLVEIDVTPADGSIGAGVFDRTGALVGIALGKFKPGDGASYVAPAAWIAELTRRGIDQLAIAGTPPPGGPPAAGAADATPGTGPHVGDRWRYRLIDGKRAVGTLAIHVVEVRGKSVRERITREDEKSFRMERTVDAEFNPVRFQEIVTLPGGYQLSEISPYASPDQGPKAGQRWHDIPVSFLLVWYGKKKFLMQARAVRHENVRVPAGSFNAMLMEAVVKENLGSSLVKITCKYWYAPEMKRAVKMSLQLEYSVGAVNSAAEIYELIAFEPAK